MDDKNYIIHRITSGTTSIEEFDYDKLQAPPIYSLFNQSDIDQLHYLASSARYSAKPDVKYREIDRIMNSRGFVKFIRGTNRTSYRYRENLGFIAKVATDSVGLGDNPREYSNQFLFKPFVTKVFEVTPCGTLGFFERVNPITSTEEFLSIAEDIYSVITNIFIGEYVLEDFGTKFFMNWGLRKNFGPVLLDFPYVYRIDPKRLFCNSPSLNSISGRCEGEIDYDDGFNYLHCTKCGALYKASELSEKIKSNNIIVKSKGEYKMKVKVKGGNSIVKEGTTGDFAGMANSIPRRTSNKVSFSGARKKENEKKEVPKTPEKEEERHVLKEAVKEEKTVNGVQETVSPITFDETYKKFIEDNKDKWVAKMKQEMFGAPEEFRTAFIYDFYEEELEDYKKKLKADKKKSEAAQAKSDKAIEAYKEKIKKLNKTIKDLKAELKDVQKAEPTAEVKELDISDIDTLRLIAKKLEDVDYNTIVDFVSATDTSTLFYIISAALNNCDDVLSMEFNINDIYYKKDAIDGKEPGIVVTFTETIIYRDNCSNPANIFSIASDKVSEILISIDDINDMIYNEDGKRYNDFYMYNGAIVNAKEIIEDMESSKIIVALDNNGEYVTKDDKIIAIKSLQDRAVSKLAVVSAAYLEGLQATVAAIEDKDNESVEKEEQNE